LPKAFGWLDFQTSKKNFGKKEKIYRKGNFFDENQAVIPGGVFLLFSRAKRLVFFPNRLVRKSH